MQQTREVFTDLLEKNYVLEKTGPFPVRSKLHFIGQYIFGFITDDHSMDELLAGKMLKVIQAIIEVNMYEFIEDKNNFYEFIIMANMPFLKEKLTWGTSLRGAWFDEYRYTETCNGEILLSGSEINEFLFALVKWAEP